MNTREDKTWKSLLVQSAPTFAGNPAPPFGLTTRILADLRETQGQEAAWERIGRRAILAALGAVSLLVIITFARAPHDDVEAPVPSLALLENVQVS